MLEWAFRPLNLYPKPSSGQGDPVEEILKAVDEEGCDVIVLGTHGKGFLEQTFLGSVSSSVLLRTRKPVFVIPLPSEDANTDLI
jgi:nucleotide-binding universal stress UspA family protein